MWGASPVAEWAASGQVKIERAKEHINALAGEIAAFHQSSPYAIVGGDEQGTGDWVLRAQITNRPPLRWGAIAGDAIHNLRASLDVLWRHVIRAKPDDMTDFPFYRSEKKFNEARNREK